MVVMLTDLWTYFQFFVGNGYNSKYNYYSPLFYGSIYPLYLLRLPGLILFEIGLIACAIITIYQLRKMKWYFQVVVIVSLYGEVLAGNADLLVLLGIVWLFQRTRKATIVEGAVLGLLSFKPIVVLVLPFLLLEIPRSRRLDFLVGGVLTTCANWAYLLFDMQMLSAFLHNIGNNYWTWWMIPTYSWLLYAIIHVITWKRKRRLVKRLILAQSVQSLA